MSRIARAGGAAALWVTMVGTSSADGPAPAPEQRTCIDLAAVPANTLTTPAKPLPKRQRVRSISEHIGKIIDQGIERSPTFGGLVGRLEQSPVLVYVEPGRCPAIRRQRLNGCLADLGTVGDTRYLRATLDVRLSIDRLIATVGHELQHAIEAIGSNSGAPGHGENFIGAAARPVGANVYETNAAQDVKEAILRDLRRAGPRYSVAAGTLPPE